MLIFKRFFKTLYFILLAVLGFLWCLRAILSCGGRGCSLWWLLLCSTGSRHVGFMPRIVLHGLSSFKASGIFPDQRLNLCALRWQTDS